MRQIDINAVAVAVLFIAVSFGSSGDPAPLGRSYIESGSPLRSVGGVDLAGLATAARRGVRRGVTVALIGSLAILAAAAPMSWFFPDIEFWWWVWPGFTLAILLWSVLDLRDLTRWQRAARCELFMRYDVRVLSSATRAGDRLVAVETAD